VTADVDHIVIVFAVVTTAVGIAHGGDSVAHVAVAE
jgi:hypothetical protein